jgi:DNA-binding NarL/FixJ family response regulator
MAQPLRILVADDDPAFREEIAEVIGAGGYAELAGFATDGGEAVVLYSRLQPDVVLMDIVMPRLDGISATKAILSRHPEARVVAVTESDDHRLLSLCMEAGAIGCLRKDGQTVVAALIAALSHGFAPRER